MDKKPKKTRKGKIDRYFKTSMFDGDDSIDGFWQSQDEREQSEAQKMKEEATKGYDLESKQNFRGKLRHFFLPKSAVMNESGNEKTQAISKESEQYIKKDYRYIQMRLDLAQITPEFEQELESYRSRGIRVRQAIMRDIDVLVRLYNRAFMMGADPWSPATVEQFKEILTYGDTAVFIATNYGEDVGFIILDLEGADKEIGVICGLGVEPKWQRRGFARCLGLAAWDFFRSLEVKELRCEVFEGNAASYRLIKSLDFIEVGEKYYQF